MIGTLILVSTLGQNCGPNGCPRPSLAARLFAPAPRSVNYSTTVVAPQAVEMVSGPEVERFASTRTYQVIDGIDPNSNRRRVLECRDANGIYYLHEPIKVNRVSPLPDLDPLPVEVAPSNPTPTTAPRRTVGPLGNPIEAVPERTPWSNIVPPGQRNSRGIIEVSPLPEDDTKSRPRVMTAQVPKFGVDRERLNQAQGFQSPGDTRSKRFIAGVMAAEDGDPDSSIPDDSGKPFLTVIGEPSETAPVMAAIRGDGPLAGVAKGMHVHEYKPGSRYVQDVKLPADGKPTILVQLPTGTVTMDQKSYDGNEVLLAQNITGALRQPNPNFDPARTPEPGGPATTPGMVKIFVGIAIVFACLVGIVFYSMWIKDPESR